MPLLSVEGVTMQFSGRPILRDVSLKLASGELMGLIGPNGAGKSTLMKIILGLLRPTSGRVQVEGRARGRSGKSVAYVPQSISFDPDLPVRARDLVALGVDGNRFGVPLPSKARRTAVDEALDAVDASSFANARLGSLSGGEQQRIVVAHALAASPRLLLLDEPLANLDLRSERTIVEILGNISHNRGIGVLVSTHDMNPLLGVMDRVAYIANGRLASGSTDEVVTTEALTRLYGHHVDVLRVHNRVIVVAGEEGSAFEHTAEETVASIV